VGRFTLTIATGAVCALACATVATGAPVADGFPEPAVTTTYPTSSPPSLVRYAYGAAWTGTESGSLVRITPGGAATKTVRLPGTLVDVTEGYGRIWVLWRKGARSYVTPVNPRSARIIGRATRTRVPGRPARIRAGAGALWVAALGNKVTARGGLTRVDPKRLRVSTRRWLTPTDFFVERGLIWSFNGFKLVARRPGDLRVRHRVSAFSGFGGVTYGLGEFWTSSTGPTGNGGVTEIQPTRGRGQVLAFPTDYDINAGGPITTGAGSVWSTFQVAPSEVSPAGASAWGLVGYEPSGTQEGFVGLPVDGTPDVAFGGGSFWVTDPGGQRVLQIAPPAS
jgi:hypothetical protein